MAIIINGRIATSIDPASSNMDRIIYVPAGVRIHDLDDLENKIRTNEIYEIDKVYSVEANTPISYANLENKKTWFMYKEVDIRTLTGEMPGVVFTLDSAKTILGYSCYVKMSSISSLKNSALCFFDTNHGGSSTTENYKILAYVPLSAEVEETKYKTTDGESFYKVTYYLETEMTLQAGQYFAALDIPNCDGIFATDPDITDYMGTKISAWCFTNKDVGDYLAGHGTVTDVGTILFTINFKQELKYDPIPTSTIELTYDDTRKNVYWTITENSQDVSSYVKEYHINIGTDEYVVTAQQFNMKNYPAGTYTANIYAVSDRDAISSTFSLTFTTTESPTLPTYDLLNNTSHIFIKYVPTEDQTISSFAIYVKTDYQKFNQHALVLDSSYSIIEHSSTIDTTNNVILEKEDGSTVIAAEFLVNLATPINLIAGNTYWFSGATLYGSMENLYYITNDETGEYALYTDAEYKYQNTSGTVTLGAVQSDKTIFLQVNVE